MMSEHRDPVLQTLFDVDKKNLNNQDSEAFTARVMAKTRSLRYWLAGILGVVALIFLICVWIFEIPLQEVVQIITQALGTTLFDLGDSWVSWVFTPVNNIASLLVLSVKAVRVIRKKVLGVSWSN